MDADDEQPLTRRSPTLRRDLDPPASLGELEGVNRIFMRDEATGEVRINPKAAAEEYVRQRNRLQELQFRLKENPKENAIEIDEESKDTIRSLSTIRAHFENELRQESRRGSGIEDLRKALDAIDLRRFEHVQFDDEERDETRQRLNVIRMLQLCLGDVRVEPTRPDVYAGYTANAPDKVPEKDRIAAARKLAEMFPTDDPETNREIARTIGMLEVQDEVTAKFAETLSGCWNLGSGVQDDIHFLIVVSRLSGERSRAMTKKTAGTLAFLHMKMLIGEMFPSRDWPLRVGETFVELCKQDPKLAEALATHRDFGLPSHAMFAKLMPDKERKVAVQRMFERAKRSPDEVWTPDMVSLFAQLKDEEVANAIRDQWHNYGLRDAIIAAIHANPHPNDRKLFADALKETNTTTVARAAMALANLGEEGSPDEIAAVLTALRHQSADSKAVEVRQAIAQTIRVLANQEFTFAVEKEGDILLAYRPAFNWFAKTHQEASAELNRLSALDGIDWDERISKIDFTAGDVTRGKKVYESQSCGKCHSGRNRLGPALEGVTGRWSRADLIKEIVDPNRNVAPQFLTSRLETKDGKVYQGVPIYQSPDGTLLQTGPDETIRIAGPEVVSISKSRTSLMPTGLLRGLSDEEIADLYVYLKTLTVKPQ